MSREVDVRDGIEWITREYEEAAMDFPRFNSAHEGYAIILEELDEAWDEIKANRNGLARQEMAQVGAMALRFLVDLPGE